MNKQEFDYLRSEHTRYWSHIGSNKLREKPVGMRIRFDCGCIPCAIANQIRLLDNKCARCPVTQWRKQAQGPLFLPYGPLNAYNVPIPCQDSPYSPYHLWMAGHDIVYHAYQVANMKWEFLPEYESIPFSSVFNAGVEVPTIVKIADLKQEPVPTPNEKEPEPCSISKGEIRKSIEEKIRCITESIHTRVIAEIRQGQKDNERSIKEYNSEIIVLQKNLAQLMKQQQDQWEIYDTNAPRAGEYWSDLETSMLKENFLQFVHQEASKRGRSTLSIRYKIASLIEPSVLITEYNNKTRKG